MSGFMLCFDLMEQVGQDVQKKREQDTLDYWIRLYHNIYTNQKGKKWASSPCVGRYNLDWIGGMNEFSVCRAIEELGESLDDIVYLMGRDDGWSHPIALAACHARLSAGYNLNLLDKMKYYDELESEDVDDDNEEYEYWGSPAFQKHVVGTPW